MEPAQNPPYDHPSNFPSSDQELLEALLPGVSLEEVRFNCLRRIVKVISGQPTHYLFRVDKQLTEARRWFTLQ